MKQEAEQSIAMERSLLEKMIEAQGGSGEPILATIKYAVLPIAKVFTMCFLGYLMASKYVNILPASGRKLLNGVSFFFVLFFYYFFKKFLSMLLRSYLNRFVHHTASILTPTALSYIFSIGESNYFRKVATVVSMFSPFLNFEF